MGGDVARCIGTPLEITAETSHFKHRSFNVK